MYVPIVYGFLPEINVFVFVFVFVSKRSIAHAICGTCQQQLSHMTAAQAETKMAAEIQTERVGAGGTAGGVRKPQLVNKLEGCSSVINMAVIIPREDGVISVGDDRFV